MCILHLPAIGRHNSWSIHAQCLSLTYALQVGDLHAKSLQQRDDPPVVDGDQRDDADGVEQRQRGGGDDEAATKHVPVHVGALHHEEAAHLHAVACSVSSRMTSPQIHRDPKTMS